MMMMMMMTKFQPDTSIHGRDITTYAVSRFLKTNDCHIEILLPTLILTFTVIGI